MTISFTSRFPADQATKVTRDLATSLSNSINFTITSTTAIQPLSLIVSINNQKVINAGVAVTGSRYTSLITTTLNSISVSFTFASPTDMFASFETITIDVYATDTSSSFEQAYSFRIIDQIEPVIIAFQPDAYSVSNLLTTPISFIIQDTQSGVDQSSLNTTINMKDKNDITIGSYNVIINGNFQPGFSGTITKDQDKLNILMNKDTGYQSDSNIIVDIEVSDEANIINQTYSFDIIDISPPIVSGLIPAPMSSNILESTSIAITLSDINSSGINLTSINVKINQFDAIKNGVIQTSILGSGSVINSVLPGVVNLVLQPLNDLTSASSVNIYVECKDNYANQVTKSYSFKIRDSKPPSIIDKYPDDGYQHILPNTDIRFSIVEEPDGYGLDFQNLQITIDGYSILNHLWNSIPVEGYYSEYLNKTFNQDGVDINEYFTTPTIDGYYPGFITTINSKELNTYEVIINPQIDFEYGSNVSVRISAPDLGGHTIVENYTFETAAIGEIVTVATPNTKTYKNFIDGYGVHHASEFLFETGVSFTTNLLGTTTYYTIDGSIPRIDSYNRVLNTTQVFTTPIKINKQGLNVLKYFSIDTSGNKETLKQEVYMIDIVPPSISAINSVKIISDIPYPTVIIPVEDTSLFRPDQLVKVLDDTRPPIFTKILTINNTSNPQFIIVDTSVDKLKVIRNARVEIARQLINTLDPIDFDATKVGEELYIGSDGTGHNQADAVFEQFRILNKYSTDEEVLADFTLLSKGTKFFNQQVPITLSVEYSSLETTRANMPDNTLVLLDFDGNVLSKPRSGKLANNTTGVVDVAAASNDIIITVIIKEGEIVDKELLTSLLVQFAPVDLNIIVKFENIQ